LACQAGASASRRKDTTFPIPTVSVGIQNPACAKPPVKRWHLIFAILDSTFLVFQRTFPNSDPTFPDFDSTFLNSDPTFPDFDPTFPDFQPIFCRLVHTITFFGAGIIFGL
jgi:hypothetical protein